MHPQSNSSIGIGRWGGLEIRLHMFFLVFSAFTIFLCWSRDTGAREQSAWLAAGSILILFASVLVHELAHLFVSAQVGGSASAIIISPLGGLSDIEVPQDPRQALTMHLAGPTANLAINAACGFMLFFLSESDVLGLWNPLAPSDLLAGSPAIIGLKLTCWINWVLFLVSLLPCEPFDGGRAMQSGLLTARPDLHPMQALFMTASLSKVLAVIMLVMAIMQWSNNANTAVPTWFPLIVLSIFLFFSGRQGESHALQESIARSPLEQPAEYDFSEGYSSLERSLDANDDHEASHRRWILDRQESQRQRQREIEADEERRVDEILVRVHENGMDSISSDEKSLLQRVSTRLRARQRHQG